MTPEQSCAEIRPLLPEVALGIADGQERARAIEHLSSCPDCRAELAELTALADDLLVLAPQAEPPLGFETRTLKRIRARERWNLRRRRRRRLTFAGSAVAAAAAAVVAMILVYSGDRRLAGQYRAALQGANGQYFASARLRTRDGTAVGVVFSYQGSPSWLFYVVAGRYRTGAYNEQIVTRADETISLPRFSMAEGSWGTTTPLPVREIALVQLVRVSDGTVLHARLPPVQP
jgi:Putative zinc-finger